MIIRTLIEAAVLLVILYGLIKPGKMTAIIELENRIIEKIFKEEI